jgi:hypothetical protein
VQEPGLPTALFGKAADSGDNFRILWSRDDFPESARPSLEAISRAFGLQGSKGSHSYPSCYALWPVQHGNGWVAARLRDGGTDTLGRPHTLRIEAVFLAESAAAFPLDLLDPVAWPGGEWTKSTIVTSGSSSESTIPARRLQEAAGGVRRFSVLRAFHDAYTSSFDIELDANGDVTSSRFKTAAPGSRVPRNTSLRVSPVKFLMSTLVGCALGGVLATLWHTIDRQGVEQRHQAALNRAAEDYENAQARAEAEGARRIQLEKENNGLRIAAQVVRDVSRTEESFQAVAEAFGIRNALELRRNLETLPNRALVRESPGERVQQLIEQLQSVIDDLRGTLPRLSAGAPPAGPVDR